jgi:hypothetical protein
MASKAKAKAALPALIAESREDAKTYLETHNLTADDVVIVTPGRGGTGALRGAAVSRVRLTRAMVAHPKRVELTRAARGTAADEPAPETLESDSDESDDEDTPPLDGV